MVRATFFYAVVATVAVTLPVLATNLADAGTGYERVPMETRTRNLPPELDRFREEVLKRAARGAFASDTGDNADKAWLLSHVSPWFSCERDHGGICHGETYRERVANFVRVLGYAEVVKSDPSVGSQAGYDPGELDKLYVDVSPLAGQVEVFQAAPVDYCPAAPEPVSPALFEQVLQHLETSEAFPIDDILQAIVQMKGIVGTWNIRAEPSLSGAVVGRVSNELVYFERLEITFDDQPQPQPEPVKADGHFWHHVILPDGTKGFLAATQDRILTALSPRLCIGLEKGRPVFTRFIGGGD
ncbi:MAG: SH3 domain-containing protein [Paracoccaceae bacterium]